MLRICLCTLLIVSPVLPDTSAAAAEEAPTTLAPITIRSPGISRELLQAPAAVSVVEEPELRDGRQSLQLDESLNRVPGLLFQNRYNFAQNLRISIRGFGARAPFGVRGIRLRLDGLPLTLPDGQSQVDTIDFASLRRVEVLRGPAAAVYGNAAGGVIAIDTTDRLQRGHHVELSGQGGSYGFRRLGLRAAADGDRASAYASAWRMNYDGYREQSATDKRLVLARVEHAIDGDRGLTWLWTGLDQPFGEDPGGLTRAEVEEDRRQAAPAALNLDAGQRVRDRRVGVVYHDVGMLPGELTARAFYSIRDFRQQLPFPGPSLIGFDRDYYGASADYRDAATIDGQPLEVLIGVDAARQRDDRRRFEVDASGAAVAPIQDAVESATSAGLYAQADLGLADRIDLTLGGRVDRVRFEIDDRFTPDGAGSGNRSYREYSVTGGLGWQWRPTHRFYANLGTAFETPTFTEFYDPTVPEQGFDPDLEPQQALNLETGIKGTAGVQLRYQLTLFVIRTRDEIIQVATEPDRFANAAETRRQGIELAFEYRPSPFLTWTASWTGARYRFDRYDDGSNASLDGNRLPGLPEQTLFSELAWRSAGGAFVIADILFVGRRYADNANTVAVDGHTVGGVRAGLRRNLSSGELEVYAGIENLADRDYFSNIRINAAGGRYYEPAPERNYHAGISLRY